MHPPNTCPRRGTMAVELMVAASLVACMIGILAPLAVRASRVAMGARQVRLALSELSNQLDRLTTLQLDQIDEALEDLEVSEEVSRVLPEAKLRGNLISDDDGSRLVLSIDWERPTEAPPISLVGWIDAGGDQPQGETRP